MGASPDLVTFALLQPALLVAWLFGEVIRRILRKRVLISGALMTVVSVLGMSLGGFLLGWFLPNQKPWYLATVGPYRRRSSLQRLANEA